MHDTRSAVRGGWEPDCVSIPLKRPYLLPQRRKEFRGVCAERYFLTMAKGSRLNFQIVLLFLYLILVLELEEGMPSRVADC